MDQQATIIRPEEGDTDEPGYPRDPQIARSTAFILEKLADGHVVQLGDFSDQAGHATIADGVAARLRDLAAEQAYLAEEGYRVKWSDTATLVLPDGSAVTSFQRYSYVALVDLGEDRDPVAVALPSGARAQGPQAWHDRVVAFAEDLSREGQREGVMPDEPPVE